jgi:hypothetical protein
VVKFLGFVVFFAHKSASFTTSDAATCYVISPSLKLSSYFTRLMFGSDFAAKITLLSKFNATKTRLKFFIL